MSQPPRDVNENVDQFEAKRKRQAKELLSLLGDMDGDKVPIMKSPANPDVGVVTRPSFVQPAPTAAVAPVAPLTSVPAIVPGEAAAVGAPQTGELGPISEEPTGKVFLDMQIFFKQMGRSFAHRYSLWEETFSQVMVILRKILNIMENNTEVLIDTIGGLYTKLKKGFDDFEMKRDEVERFSGVDYTQVAKAFKKTIQLLNFQVREFKLQYTVSELFKIYTA